MIFFVFRFFYGGNVGRVAELGAQHRRRVVAGDAAQVLDEEGKMFRIGRRRGDGGEPQAVVGVVVLAGDLARQQQRRQQQVLARLLQRSVQ